MRSRKQLASIFEARSSEEGLTVQRRETASQRLRKLLASPRPEMLLEAHSAVSAKIAQDAGIPGVWASSLTLSCSHGLRDNSELTMTQVLDVLESMTEFADLPVLFDGDTGYGQFNHFQQLVRRLCARGVAGVCIEDKVFPKTNSFLDAEKQQLAPVDEFCGKIRAGKDAQTDPDFVVMARTEALVTGVGLAEALSRAGHYADAGADAILVHSKASSFDELRDFMAEWERQTPVICVPTTYDRTSQEEFARAGISLVIWANHMLRASVCAMQQLARHVSEHHSAGGLGDEIVPVRELFRIQDTDGYELASRIYEAPNDSVRAILLGASRLGPDQSLAIDRPSCLLRVDGEPALDRTVRTLRGSGVRDISVVRGAHPEQYDQEGVSFLDFSGAALPGSSELEMLWAARPALKGDLLLQYGDVVFRRYVLDELLGSEAPVTLAVDGSGMLPASARVYRVQASCPPETYTERWSGLVEIGDGRSGLREDGEWMGVARCRPEGTQLLAEALDRLVADPRGRPLRLDSIFNDLVRHQGVPVRVLYFRGDWVDAGRLASTG